MNRYIKAGFEMAFPWFLITLFIPTYLYITGIVDPQLSTAWINLALVFATVLIVFSISFFIIGVLCEYKGYTNPVVR